MTLHSQTIFLSFSILCSKFEGCAASVEMAVLLATCYDIHLAASALAGKMSEKQVNDLLRSELNKATAERPPQDSIAAFVVLKEPFSADDGTLTRTMKPRRQVIFDKYASDVERLKTMIRP